MHAGRLIRNSGKGQRLAFFALTNRPLGQHLGSSRFESYTDPVMGRFLKADPYVSLPDFTQAFNRYFLNMFWVYGTGAFSEYGASHLAGGSASGTELQDAALGTVLTFSPLSWAKGLSGGSSSVVKGGTQTVYRAVNAAEKASINSSKSFLLKEGGTEVKYFAKTLEDAHWYGSRLYSEGYSIIQGTVKSSVNVGKYWYPTVDIGAYAFPGNVLPYIRPIVP